MAERTLVLVKPDGVQRGLVGEVITRLERRGLQLVGMKLMQVADALARQHYGEHVDRPFFGGTGLVHYLVAGGGDGLGSEQRGKHCSKHFGGNQPGQFTCRYYQGDFGIDIGRNLVHGSDSAESAEREVNLFFRPEEILSYERAVEPWIVE